MALAGSGLHKTTAFTLLESGHEEADRRLATWWNEAKASYDERRASNKVQEGSRCEPESRSPRKSPPVALLQEFTSDGLLSCLQEGRPSVAMWTSEAGTQINYSFRQNQIIRTLAYLKRGMGRWKALQGHGRQGQPGLYPNRHVLHVHCLGCTARHLPARVVRSIGIEWSAVPLPNIPGRGLFKSWRPH